MSGIELKLSLSISAVTPCAEISYVIISPLCTKFQSIQPGKVLAEHTLDESVPILLPVRRRIGCRAWSSAVCIIVVRLDMEVSTCKRAEKIHACTYLSEVIISPPESISIRKITLAERTGYISRQRQALVQTEIKPEFRHICTEGSCVE